MAIKASFTNMDMTFPEAYMVVKKITVGHSMEEYFYPDSNGNEVLGFRKILEAFAHVFVYGDVIAKENGVSPVYAFSVEFNYDPVTGGNIYKEADNAVKNTERIQTTVWEDV